VRSNIPCFFQLIRIKRMVESNPEISEEQIHQELLKENTDKELHEMSENELLNLILRIMLQLRKKMAKDVKMIYV